MNHNILWTLSLLTICIIVIIWTVCSFAGIDLPDLAVRIMGIIDLCAIPVLIYSTLKMRKK